MNNYAFASRESFQAIIDFMKAKGFEFLAWVTISHKMAAYHVSHKAAQSSNLFFHLPGKTFILRLTLTECFDGEKGIFSKEIQPGVWYSAHWSGEFWMEYSWKRFWGDLFDQAIKDKGLLGFESDEIHTPSYHSFFPEKDGFIYHGNEDFFQDYRSTSFDIFKALEAIFSLVNTFSPYMYTKFKELQVTGFPPHYTFPGCEPTFWEKFPFGRLRAKVQGEIWGSDFKRK